MGIAKRGGTLSWQRAITGMTRRGRGAALLSRRMLGCVATCGLFLALVFGVAPRGAYALPVASEETERALDDVQARYEVAQSELEAVGAELEALTLARDETAADITEVEGSIAATTAEVTIAQHALQQARSVLADRVSESYKAGSASLLGVVLGSDTFDELVSGMYYLDRVVAGDRGAIDKVLDMKATLERRQAGLDEQRANLEELRLEQEWQISEVEAKQREAQKLVESLDAEVANLLVRRQLEVEEAARMAAEGAAATAGDSLRSEVISSALSLLGVPYVWGGTYPESGGTDCSGLVQWAFAQSNVAVPRTTYTQRDACETSGYFFTDASLLQPGDLVFCNNGGHVAIYLGNGWCVHEPSPGGVCSIVPITRWNGRVVGYGFPVVPSTEPAGA